ncbi:hypothetical protein [Actinorugispora endophytica]|uniref:2-keto-4-pentenoate hydratase n=1 Tax=Actinorugispora endophytica TaxID=1605990 RepID=A0A4R6UY44_9ACTN|nr:hypothetical protein [Actinorugispora endophytica]TDQ52412.1 hypothetical protein EV190_10650 [Actinorugispora endophytica]
MRWVTYLSPSGGERRPGVVDDGCVFGYPGPESMPELLAAGRDAMADAYQRALAVPVEIIVEFETRLCVPLEPRDPVPVRGADAEEQSVEPHLVHGTDDGVALPAGEPGLLADVGVAAVFGGGGGHAGYTLACLWRTLGGGRVGLTLGPAITTCDEFDGADLVVSGSVEGKPVAEAVLDGGLGWSRGLGGALVGSLPARTRLLEPGEELLVDGGPLGEFELRVGSGA